MDSLVQQEKRGEYQTAADESLPRTLVNALHGLVSTWFRHSPRKPSNAIPPRLDLRGSRDAVLDEILTQLVESQATSIALLGPAGIGKTAVAQGLLYEGAIVEKFATDRFWFDCSEVLTWDDLLSGIYEALNIALESLVDAKRGVGQCSTEMSTGCSSSQTCGPALVVLDRFDSIWNKSDYDTRQAVTDRLTHLWNAHRVSVVVTMRGTVPPPFVEWAKTIGPLDYGSARWLFLSIHPVSDESLPGLLRSLQGIPQAIISLAHSGRQDGMSPAALQAYWEMEQEKLRESITEPALTDHARGSQVVVGTRSDAMKLLAILSMLPARIREADLSHMAPQIDDITDAVRAITQHSLVALHADGYLDIISPMRTYSLQYHHLDMESRQNMYDYYFSRTRRVASRPGEKGYLERVNFFLEQEANIFAVLEDALDRDCPAAVTAAVDHSDLLCCTAARPRVVRKAVAAARKLSSPELLSRCLEWQANVYRAVGELRLAIKVFGQAADEYHLLSDQIATIRCLQAQGEILYRCGDRGDGLLRLRTARERFAQSGDRMGEFNCLLELAKISRTEDREQEAMALYDQAQSLLTNLDDDLGVAMNQFYIAAIPAGGQSQLSLVDARAALKNAAEIFERHLNFSAVSECLTAMLALTRDPAERCELTERILGIHRRLGRRLEAAFAARWLAESYTQLDRFEEALILYEQAIPEFWNYAFVFAGAECQFQKGFVLIQMDRISEASLAFQLARQQNVRTEDRFRAAASLHAMIWCHHVLGTHDTEQQLRIDHADELRWFNGDQPSHETENVDMDLATAVVQA